MYCLQLTIRLIYLLAALQQEHITPQGATPSKVKLVFFTGLANPKPEAMACAHLLLAGVLGVRGYVGARAGVSHRGSPSSLPGLGSGQDGRRCISHRLRDRIVIRACRLHWLRNRHDWIGRAARLGRVGCPCGQPWLHCWHGLSWPRVWVHLLPHTLRHPFDYLSC